LIVVYSPYPGIIVLVPKTFPNADTTLFSTTDEPIGIDILMAAMCLVQVIDWFILLRL
jgi:hypothetical protein